MTLVACCVQANCTAIAPIVVQVVDSCPTCSPNEVRLPADIYSSRLIPAAQQPVFIQYRLVSVVTFGEGFVLLVLHPGGLANTRQHSGGLRAFLVIAAHLQDIKDGFTCKIVV